jgi:hypothetical protein
MLKSQFGKINCIAFICFNKYLAWWWPFSFEICCNKHYKLIFVNAFVPLIIRKHYGISNLKNYAEFFNAEACDVRSYDYVFWRNVT